MTGFLSDSWPVNKSFHYTTPYFPDPQKQMKLAILRTIFKKHLSLSVQSIHRCPSSKICQPLKAAKSQNTKYTQSHSWSVPERPHANIIYLTGWVRIQFKRILRINPLLKVNGLSSKSISAIQIVFAFSSLPLPSVKMRKSPGKL